MKTAVIIAGGEGQRLMPLTKNRPKTMVKVLNKPILYWILRWLKKYGIEHVVLGVAYKKETIYKYMKANNNFGLKVDFSEHTVKGGTAEAFKLAIERFVRDENFLAMNSDELTNMNLSEMIRKHMKHKPLVTMAIAPFYCRFSVVKVNRRKRVVGFEYGKKLPSIQVSNGVYIFNSAIKKHLPSKGSIENLVFTKLAKKGHILAHHLKDGEGWISINTLKDRKDAEEALRTWTSEAL